MKTTKTVKQEQQQQHLKHHDHHKNKKHLFLDLDQTLVSSTKTQSFFKRPELVKLLQFFDHDIDQHYVMIARPFLQQFLDWAFKNFHVHVWTAASELYGRHIIERFILNNNNITKDNFSSSNKKTRKLGLFLFDKHTDVSRAVKPQTTKALDMLWDFWKLKDDFNTYNTFILDDLEIVKQYQPENAIHIFPFFIENKNSINDHHLLLIQSEIELIVKQKNNKLKRTNMLTTHSDHFRRLYSHNNQHQLNQLDPHQHQNHNNFKRNFENNNNDNFQLNQLNQVNQVNQLNNHHPGHHHYQLKNHHHHHCHQQEPCRKRIFSDLSFLLPTTTLAKSGTKVKKAKNSLAGSSPSSSTFFNSPKSRQLFLVNRNPIDKFKTPIQIYRSSY